ncbi:MAG: D-Ala-D-Ala dipeptidase VanX [bacterium]|nr:D-Ala-D-Ala dipeptidase VanX [bacterium]
MEQGFTFLDEAVRGIRWDAKYATWDNFTGKPVDGYLVNRIVGTFALADALKKAGETASALGYGLLLWDGYRPQRAVNCFLHWSEQPEDGLTKEKHYPNIAREEMIAKGYVAARSSHSRGSAVDLTIYNLNTGGLVPMGSNFDFMDERSHHTSEAVTVSESKHRGLLRSIMEESGFEAYENEWWHYLLKEEPYPDRYFDFPIG